MRDVEGSIAELRSIWGQGPGLHKRQADLDRYEILIERVKPAVVVETGLYYGGSAIWFAERVPHVINVELPDSTRDMKNQTTDDYRRNRWGLGEVPRNSSLIEGNSLHPETFRKTMKTARLLADGGPIMVVLDSNHDTLTVFNEAVLYGNLVTKGSYMVVEDGLLHYLPHKDGAHFEGPDTPHNWFDGDPLIAASEFMDPEGPFADGWQTDHLIEDMFPTTQHPGGWLCRTK